MILRKSRTLGPKRKWSSPKSSKKLTASCSSARMSTIHCVLRLRLTSKTKSALKLRRSNVQLKRQNVRLRLKPNRRRRLQQQKVLIQPHHLRSGSLLKTIKARRGQCLRKKLCQRHRTIYRLKQNILVMMDKTRWRRCIQAGDNFRSTCTPSVVLQNLLAVALSLCKGSKSSVIDRKSSSGRRCCRNITPRACSLSMQCEHSGSGFAVR